MDKVMELYVRGINELGGALQPRKGQGLVEYALIIALVSVALIGALGLLRGGIAKAFDNVIAAL